MRIELREKWFRNRGYLHLSPKLNLDSEGDYIFKKISNPRYVAHHSFFPLIHANIKERRYKKDPATEKRCHTASTGKSNAKIRPLHFASHLDSLIFAYYADKLKVLYEGVLATEPEVSECITAYRQIPDPNSPGKNKSTIHFAHEAFEHIKTKAEKNKQCAVLKFDIEKFFSGINHKLLKASWSNLLEQKELPKDHYQVFRACTNFSYMLKDDLRISQSNNGRKAGFDEKKLAEIRKKGIECFFENPAEFRQAIKSGQLKVYKNPFYSKADKTRKGIPQGLPISATLANLYLLEFDRNVVKEIVKKRNGYYRRYSDDILIVVPVDEEEWANKYITKLILESKVSISTDKTEIFRFIKSTDTTGKSIIKGFLKKEHDLVDTTPLNYLGFDFYGFKTLIASKNLSKFYRRMKTSVKKKVKIATKKFQKDEIDRSGVAVYKRQLYKIYTSLNLEKSNPTKKRKKLIKNIFGYYYFKSHIQFPPFKGNYLSYAKRAAKIMEEPAIENQIRNHKRIFNKAIRERIRKSKSLL